MVFVGCKIVDAPRAEPTVAGIASSKHQRFIGDGQRCVVESQRVGGVGVPVVHEGVVAVGFVAGS